MFRKIAILATSIIIGIASTDIFAVGGSVTDTELQSVICKNLTTQETINITDLQGATSWDCTQRELKTSVGDIIQEIITGKIIETNVLRTIIWAEPYIDNSGTNLLCKMKYNNFKENENNNGFNIRFLRTGPRDNCEHWKIQVVPNSDVELEEKEYKIQFDVETNKNGAIYFNIQTHDQENMKQIFPADIKIDVNKVNKDGNNHFSRTFTGNTEVGRLLTFKFGKDIQNNTKIIVKNISITPNN